MTEDEISSIAYWLAGLLIIMVVVLVIAYPRMQGAVESAIVLLPLFAYIIAQVACLLKLREAGRLPKNVGDVIWLLGPGTFTSSDFLRGKNDHDGPF